MVYTPTGEPFQSKFFYESLILPLESCSEEELAAFELLKTIFPWVALPLACCCCCYCQRRNKGVWVVAVTRIGSFQQIESSSVPFPSQHKEGSCSQHVSRSCLASVPSSSVGQEQPDSALILSPCLWSSKNFLTYVYNKLINFIC